MRVGSRIPRPVVDAVENAGETVGAALVRDPRIDGVAFTGSLKTAQSVAQACARTFKPALIEASGNDPFIVMPSAPVDIAARGVAFASFLNAGQVCTSAERIYVHEAMHDTFVDDLVGVARSLRIGNGLGKVEAVRDAAFAALQ